MYSFVLFLHVLICVVLLVLILMQRSKSSDIGSSFGAGASTTMFGAAGATSFLVKLTAIFGILFFATSLTLGVMSAHLVAKNTVASDVIAAATQTSKSTADVPVLPEGPSPVKN